jgi:RNA polymerase sigma-70 factor (ECF subfamily)
MPEGRSSRQDAAAELDEGRLVEAAQRDPRRFADLYELHLDRIYAYIAARVRDRDAAQDLTAEVFHRALANIRRFEWRGAPFAAWLYRMAANAIMDRARRIRRETAAAGVQIDCEPADVEQAEHSSRLYRLVRTLPEDQRRVLQLRFVEQKSIRETASQMQRSEGAIKQLQYRALETLRARMGERNG